jgi:integrase/recombinase XerD
MGSTLGMAGPLAAFAPGFGSELVARGYRPGSAAAQLQLMADASAWLAARGMGPGDLTEALVARLMDERRASGRSRLFSSRALSPLLEYPRGLGVVPPTEPVAPLTAVEAIVERYSSYLLGRRGLAPSTARNYVGVARVFLTRREQTSGGLCLDGLDAAAVSEFVLAEARRSCVGSAKCMVTRLRALLRFLHVEGEIEQALADGVPSVAGWRLASLVKALDRRSVARLLASCDRRTRVGRRDFAIITLLSRLGLRAGEIAALQP